MKPIELSCDYLKDWQKLFDNIQMTSKNVGSFGTEALGSELKTV
jgi:hypothetical protein